MGSTRQQRRRQHPFERWREAEGLTTRAAAARRLGMSRALYSLVVNGKRGLSFERCKRACKRTGGAVAHWTVIEWQAAYRRRRDAEPA